MARYTAECAKLVEAIFLDGQPLKHVLEADDEHGFIIQLVHDDEKNAFEIEGDRIKTQVLVGKVQVTLRSETG